MQNNLGLDCPFVLVGTDLDNDPDARQNTLGLVLSAVDDSMDEFSVSFPDNTTSRLPADALFTLKPMEEMQQLLIDHGADLSLPELKPLTLLVLNLRHGIGDRH